MILPIHEPFLGTYDTSTERSIWNLSFICDGKSFVKTILRRKTKYTIFLYQIMALIVGLCFRYVLFCYESTKARINIWRENGNLIFKSWRSSCWWTWTLYMEASVNLAIELFQIHFTKLKLNFIEINRKYTVMFYIENKQKEFNKN